MTRAPGTHEPHAVPDAARPGGPTRDGGADPAPLLLRPMIHSDIAAGLRLCRASGWNQIARDWEHFLARNPAGARVIQKQDVVVGTVASLRYGGFGWLAMVLVDPVERGRGLGSRLLTAGLELLSDLPCTRLDATPAGEKLYRACGFEAEAHLCRMARAGPPDPASRECARPMTSADLPRVAAWDAEVFGADRRALLDWLYLGARGYAWIANSSDGLGGYLLGRPGFAHDHLGPVVARDLSVAVQLVSACLASHPGRSFIIDAFRRTPEWIRELERMGFREQRPFIRMALGPDRFGLSECQFASAGPELG